jgi:hypothetical protein
VHILGFAFLGQHRDHDAVILLDVNNEIVGLTHEVVEHSQFGDFIQIVERFRHHLEERLAQRVVHHHLHAKIVDSVCMCSVCRRDCLCSDCLSVA